MMKMKTWDDFEKIVSLEVPLIDVRAPIEFEKGAFKNAVNLPIMNDEERHLVGICYKEKGNDEAVKLGHQLVSGEIKQARIEAWKSFMEQHPDAMLYCFRGGQRSEISQRWLTEATGKEIYRLKGGFKAFRNYLLEALEPSNLTGTPILLGGCTGVGKTILLRQLQNGIDLEHIANHRGSSFGKYLTPQPTQINFENDLAYALIQHRLKGYRYLILEDEGRNVGRCNIPKPLADYWKQSDLIIMEAPLQERIKNTLEEYVLQAQRLYLEENKEQGLEEWAEYIRESLKRIKNRLGGDRYNFVLDIFEQAFREQLITGQTQLHENWLEILLRDYYDPMYYYQIEKTKSNIIYTGNMEEVYAYIKRYLSN